MPIPINTALSLTKMPGSLNLIITTVALWVSYWQVAVTQKTAITQIKDNFTTLLCILTLCGTDTPDLFRGREEFA